MLGYRRNVAVGLTVLVALLLLGWMIMRFGDAPFRLFAREQLNIRFIADSAEGLDVGSTVEYRGVPNGHVTAMRVAEDQRHVIIDAVVDNERLPANLEGKIRAKLIGGGSSLVLTLVPPAATQPSTGPVLPNLEELSREIMPVGQLKDGTTLRARFVGYEIVPPEFTELAADLTETSRELRRATQQFRDSAIVPKMAATIERLRDDIEKAGDVLDSVHALVADPEMRRNLKESIANFRSASATAVRIGDNLEAISKKAGAQIDELAANGNKMLSTAQSRVDEIGKQAGDRLVEVARILNNLDAATKKLNEGQGTAGQLLNNPALYQNLLDTSRELDETIKSLRRVVEQWEEEGVPIRLGKK